MTLEYQSILDERKSPTAGEIAVAILCIMLGVFTFVATLLCIWIGMNVLMGWMSSLERALAILPAVSGTLGGLATWALFRHAIRLLRGESRQRPAFTWRYRMAVARAVQEAWSRGASEIEPIHLLAGVLACPPNTAVLALTKVGGDVDQMLARLDAIQPVQKPMDGEKARVVGTGPQAGRIIKLAARLARESGREHVGTEHLLIALLREAPEVLDAGWPGASRGGQILESAIEDLWFTSRDKVMAEVRERALVQGV